MLTARQLLPLIILVLLATGACTPAPLPGTALGLAWQPGRYLTAYARADAFQPEARRYRLGDFNLEKTDGIDAESASRIFQAELAAALVDNGLKVDPGQAECTLEGTIHIFSLRPPFLRWLTGRCHADLVVSGTILQGTEPVFAFQDRVAFTVLVTPRQPPLEAELLARRAVRQFANNLLNEMLLKPLPPKPRVQEVAPPEPPEPAEAPPPQGVVADEG